MTVAASLILPGASYAALRWSGASESVAENILVGALLDAWRFWLVCAIVLVAGQSSPSLRSIQYAVI